MVAPDKGNIESRDRELLRVLLDNKSISQAQADLIQADHEATGMEVEEILLARGWVNEETLNNLAPWLHDELEVETETSNRDGGGGGGNSYEENLKKYRLLLAELLGESSE